MDSKEECKEIVHKKVGGTNIFQIISTVTKQVGTVAVIYLLGYYNISPAWLIGPLILSVIRNEWKKEKEIKRNIAKAAAMSNEKEVILARIDELPAWVFFPDVERAEWVNRILFQVWPNVNHYGKEVIKNVIEPNIELALAEYKLSGFRFDKMRLGTIPPRIGGIKVYDRNVSRNEIIMDIDLFYAGDCDISFVLGGLSGGIKDFQIHGLLRVVMKPLITTMPLVGGLQIFFLNNPTIDFNLVGVADLLDMPGLSDLLRRVIVEQMAAIMVLPNKLPITLSDAVPAQSLKFPEPEGVIRVHVVEAKQLMKKDIGMLGKGKSDPYAIITVGAQTFKTKTIDNSVEPKWDYWCEFSIDALIGQAVTVTVMDEDHSKKDSFLGRQMVLSIVYNGKHFEHLKHYYRQHHWSTIPRATVEVCNVTKRGVLDTWVSLEEAKTGMVHLRITWLQFSTNLADLQLAIAETQQLRLTHMSTALLIVFVDSAKNLPCPRVGTKPDPSIQLSVAKTSHNSNIIYRTDCPVYEQGFTFLVHNPETDTLHLKIVDQKTSADLGYLSYNLRQLLEKENLELDDQPLRLTKSGPESKVILSMRLLILKYIPINEAAVASEPEKVEPEVSETTPSIAETTVVDNPSIPPRHVPVADFVEKEASENVTSTPGDATVVLSAAPKLESELAATLHHRTLSTTSSSGEFGLGRIQITLRYSVQRQRLVIVVHKVANLPLKDPSNIPDPYVKLYLLPERAKDTKRKTEAVKDNCNPTYDETFEYVISQAELNGRQLEVTVLSQKTWKSPVMGQVIIPLGNEELKLSKAVTAWYDLQPGNES